MRLKRIIYLMTSAVIACTASSYRRAMADDQGIAAFYRRTTLHIDVGTGPGGGYDANARLVAVYLSRFIPGHPTIVVDNLPGGGGIQDVNILYNAAPRDGSVISTFSNAMITEPMLGAGQAKFKPAELNWIGSASREDGICVARSSSGVSNWMDLLQHTLVVGTAAPGTTTYMYPAMLRNLFGAKFKIVSGYPDGGQIDLALQRGEIQSICQTYSSLVVKHLDWFKSGFVHPLVALGLSRIPNLPNVPSAVELAKTSKVKQIVEAILAPTLAGRPFAAPPGVPKPRVAALRDAFDAMTRNPEYLAQAHKMKMEVDLQSGSKIEALVKRIYSMPANQIAETRRAVAIQGAQ